MLIKSWARQTSAHRRKVLVLCAGVAAALLTVLPAGCGIFDSPEENFDFSPLEFPFSSSRAVVRMAAFGTPNWSGSEPHNGIDLVIGEGGGSAEIVSPTPGTVIGVRESTNPYSTPPQTMFSVEIRVNGTWTVNLVLEPGASSSATVAAQRAALRISDGQVLAAGERVGDLLVGEAGYPHLHYMVSRGGSVVCAYEHSSAAARDIFDAVSARTGAAPCY